MPKDEQNSSRRDFIQKLAALGTAGVITPTLLSACGGGEEQAANAETAEEGFACVDRAELTEAQIQQRQNAEYVDESPNPDQRCDNCALYTVEEEGAECGGCQVLPGGVAAQGWCNLWVAQQA